MTQEYDFDKLTERRGTGCVKWDEACAPDIIPLWVADMDFAVAPAIQEAVRRRAGHPVYGYTHVGSDYYDAIIAWFHRRHQWEIHREEILYTTGVVPAMSVALRALTMPGEKVVILSPDYNCFFSSIHNNGCEVSESPLTSLLSPHASHPSPHTPHSFEVDWTDFETRCADPKTTVFLLCNPHNPTGRVWTANELRRMNDICLRHGVRVISDEIHCELTMPGHRFQPFAAVSDECRRNCVVLNSPSKSFNTAGLMTANIICADADLRRRLDRAINIHEVCDLNPFGPVALMAAYNDSEGWIDALCDYLWENFQVLSQLFSERLPQCRVTPLEGTYLVWADVSALLPFTAKDGTRAVNVEQLCDYIMREARVWVNPGTMYGPQTGEGFIRINIACPRQLLTEALQRLCDVL